MSIASLRGIRQFGHVSSDGKRCGRDFIQLRFIENSMKLSRVGIVIPAKAVKNAVDRNRVRRLIRESVRQTAAIRDGFDIVFMVRSLPKVDNMHFVKEKITELLELSHLLNV
jgi:ribonuclease P protein component